MNIYALSSGRGPSGIAIVRISGNETLNICQNLIKSKDIKSNEVNFCKFYDPKNDNVIDPEAILLWFPGPNSYALNDFYNSRKPENTIMSLGVDVTHGFFKQNKYLDPLKEIIVKNIKNNETLKKFSKIISNRGLSL